MSLNPGKYPARATAIQFGSSSKGTAQVAVTYEVTDGPGAGHSITWIGFFTENTTERTIESLVNSGWKGTDLTELDGLEGEKVFAALGNEVSLTIENETYEGKTRPRVRWVNKAAQQFEMKNKLSKEGLASLSNSIKGAVVMKQKEQNG
jgi:hypothetical protein